MITHLSARQSAAFQILMSALDSHFEYESIRAREPSLSEAHSEMSAALKEEHDQKATENNVYDLATYKNNVIGKYLIEIKKTDPNIGICASLAICAAEAEIELVKILSQQEDGNLPWHTNLISAANLLDDAVRLSGNRRTVPERPYTIKSHDNAAKIYTLHDREVCRIIRADGEEEFNFDNRCDLVLNALNWYHNRGRMFCHVWEFIRGDSKLATTEFELVLDAKSYTDAVEKGITHMRTKSLDNPADLLEFNPTARTFSFAGGDTITLKATHQIRGLKDLPDIFPTIEE